MVQYDKNNIKENCNFNNLTLNVKNNHNNKLKPLKFYGNSKKFNRKRTEEKKLRIKHRSK